ncbi:MAG TPA: CHAT domain-containing tetratricopeptide repeat protein, partial [Polyangiaceae bacterium]
EEGDYASAEQCFREAVDISRKAGDRGRANEIAALNGLASLYSEQGKYEQAVPYAEEVLRAWQGSGPEQPNAGLAHLTLGQIYVGVGDNEHARVQLEQALAIADKNSDAQAAAQALLALAGLRSLTNDWVGAEAAYQAVIEQLKPFSSVSAKLAIGHALGGLASLRLARRDFAAAEDLTRQAIAVASVAGPDNAETVAFEVGLAQLLTIKKDFDGAEQMLQRAVTSLERSGGKDNPALAEVLFGKALVQWARADAAGAFRMMGAGLDIQERQLTRTLTMGSEEQRRLLLADANMGGNSAIALHMSAYRAVPAAMHLAMLAVLRRKGRLLDTVSNTTRVLREHLSASDAALFDRLRSLRSTIARRAIASSDGDAAHEPGGNDESLREEADALEAQIASRSAPFQAVAQPITLEGVASAIPSDAALVEIMSYRPILPHAPNVGQMWGSPRYAAYVLRQDGSLKDADLGEAKVIDDVASSFREALSHPGSDAKRTGRALDELVMRPIRQLVGNVRQLLISPDGALDVVPFAAMVDEQGRYLIDDWHISYLSSGRDLLRPKGLEPRSPALVIANPAFGGTDTSSGAYGLHARPLQFTEREGRAVAESLGSSDLWLQAAASKSALLQVKAPAVLHIATHGFFLDDVETPSGPARDFFRVGAKEAAPSNPLLRSGLALAGANLAGGEGILTALEASSLDLWGTKLVVLSACDTGVGEIKNGEGVLGLRRAFTMAGAASLVMSLWVVDDEGTRDLMTAYYAGLARGEGRAEALRNVQLTMSHSAKYADPWHWASFVEYGDGAPLAAKLTSHSVAPSPPPVHSSTGRLGCGCSVIGDASRNLNAALVSLALAALYSRRRLSRARNHRNDAETSGIFR